MTIAVSTVNVIVLTLLAHRNRDIAGLAIWALSIWMILFGTLGILLRLIDQLWLSVLLTNFFIISGLHLPAIGANRFLGQPYRWQRDFIALFIVLCTMMFFTVFYDNFRLRTTLGSLFMIYSTWVLYRSLKHAGRIPLSRLIFNSGALIIAIISALRTINVIFNSQDTSLLSNSLINNLAFILILVGTWLYTYAMVIAPGEDKQRQLADLSERDSLTRILNRRAFIGRYDAREVTAGKHIAVMLIDIDFFKQVNDTHGHLIGDLVLKELSNYIRTTKRSSDVFARLGGEEFALFFEEKDATHAMTMAHQLCERTAHHFKINCPKLPDITFSAGVAVSRSKVPIETLLFAADHYLYKAKNNGRNQVCGPA